jgi:hypothetical protein
MKKIHDCKTSVPLKPVISIRKGLLVASIYVMWLFQCLMQWWSGELYKIWLRMEDEDNYLFTFYVDLRMRGASPSRHLCSLKRWYSSTANFSPSVNANFVHNYYLKLPKTCCFQCKIVGKVQASKKTSSARDNAFFLKRQFLRTWQDRQNILIFKINRWINR